MADIRSGTVKVQYEPGTSWHTKAKEALKDYEKYLGKGSRSQAEEIPLAKDGTIFTVVWDT